jgi:hypothetical protein
MVGEQLQCHCGFTIATQVHPVSVLLLVYSG